MSKFLGSAMEIELTGKYVNSGYFAFVLYKYLPNKEKYSVELWLRRKDIDDLFSVGGQKIECQLITSSKETIKEDIQKIIDIMCERKMFDEYIERFVFTYKACDLGGDILERERLAKKD